MFKFCVAPGGSARAVKSKYIVTFAVRQIIMEMANYASKANHFYFSIDYSVAINVIATVLLAVYRTHCDR